MIITSKSAKGKPGPPMQKPGKEGIVQFGKLSSGNGGFALRSIKNRLFLDFD